MVAISLYRGNLHKVPDVPRRWLMPNHTISLKDFKSLLRKRDKTLSRLRSITTTTTTTSSNPNPNPNPNSTPDQQKQHEFIGDNGCSKQKPLPITTILPSQPKIQTIHVAVGKPLETVEEDPVQQNRLAGDANDQTGSGSDNSVEEEPKGIGIGDSLASPDAKSVIPEGGNGAVGVSQPVEEEKQPALPVEISNNVDLPSDKEKKKRDLEENLKVLNERKHNLVQMLKQILNAEEEIKRRNNMQLSAVRPSGPQQVEATADLGSNPRQVVNRVDAEATFCGDLEGESEDLSNHNANACQPRRMRSISPSSSSPLRKVAPNSLQHTMTNRPSIGVTGHAQTASGLSAGVISSPSRFAPSGQQGQPVILPPLSVSGTHCTASSPSPAASGGTSVFRDARITSPSWN